LVVAAAAPSAAQSWGAGRASPHLGELVAIDATGEREWPYGSEDLAGDGETFGPDEQSIDVRSGYARTAEQQLLLRAYFSSATAPPETTTVFVFVDGDQDAATGGDAEALQVHPRFTSDPSNGGYEFVIAMSGNGMVSGWEWQNAAATFGELNWNPSQATGGSGVDVDPLRINGDTRGYIQAAVDLDVLGLTDACAATLYFRAVSGNMADSLVDLDVGRAGPCVPADRNTDGVPDVVVPSAECRDDRGCPAGGLCVEGRCVVAPPCSSDTECDAARECTADGRCVPRASGACTTSRDCDGLVCSGSQCVACGPGAACADGARCAPTGECLAGSASPDGPALSADEEVEGGACNCSVPRQRAPLGLLLTSFGLAAITLRRALRS
jgi:hypothetical protein